MFFQIQMQIVNLRISLRHGKLNVAGNEKSPLNTADLNAGTVGARNGIFPITIKYNKMPNAHTSTGPPTYESSLNTKKKTKNSTKLHPNSISFEISNKMQITFGCRIRR